MDKNCYLLDIGFGAPKKNYETWSYSPNNIHLNSKALAELAGMLFDDVLKDPKIESFDLYTGK